MTIDDILKGVSKLRNRVIARVFKELRLIEQWGSGIQRMLADCRNAGLPDPVFEELATHFKVTISLSLVRSRELDTTDSALCALLDNSRGMTTAALAKEVGLSTRTVRTRLTALTTKGILAVVGTSPPDPRRKYFLRENATF